MRYSPVHETSLEGEDFASCAANRSATFFTLKQYEKCLGDIDLAIESGYPASHVYKLHIRKCKCLLELGRIVEAQNAFDVAVDAIDRSGHKRDMRKGMAVDLQEAFITLAKSAEENPCNSEDSSDNLGNPEWSVIKDPHPKYPAASSAVSIQYDPTYGRQVVATRDIKAGEVIFNEEPIISYMHVDEEPTAESCHHCFGYLKDGGAGVPCPTCSQAMFCSRACRKRAIDTYHHHECRLGNVFR